MPTSQISGMRASAPWHYLLWLAVGALIGFGFLAMLTIGPLLVLGAAVVGGVCLYLRLVNRSLAAVPAGLGVAALYLAWLNKDGPGDVCVVTKDASTCVGEWNPLPIVLAAALLLVVAVLVWAVAPTVLRLLLGPPPPPSPATGDVA